MLHVIDLWNILPQDAVLAIICVALKGDREIPSILTIVLMIPQAQGQSAFPDWVHISGREVIWLMGFLSIHKPPEYVRWNSN